MRSAGLLHHFRTKDALVAHLIGGHARLLCAQVSRACDVEEYVDAARHYACLHPEAARIYGEVIFGSGLVGPLSRRMVLRLRRAFVERLCVLAMRGGAVGVDERGAQSRLASLEGAVVAIAAGLIDTRPDRGGH